MQQLFEIFRKSDDVTTITPEQKSAFSFSLQPMDQTKHTASLNGKTNEESHKTSLTNRQYAIYEVEGLKQKITNIFDACEVGDHRALMRYAKTKDFEIDAKDRYGRTALIWAADCGHEHICESLIRLSADIHLTDLHSGRSAIHWAARAGSLPIVRMLVQFGAKIAKEDKYGLTPLYLAKSIGANGEDVFRYLLSEGAPFNEQKEINMSEIEAAIAAEMAALEAREGNDKSIS
ncbi:hypothetical protein O6H91_01G033000 [Diphasiastrum complanatum]|uniref:Uncharacterized protein n=1 Tax=Diphasiastrum complanatum TaxID=34168 RepID=A0ACC2EPN6_DIPCM|nr:hypothetical protein O6H91_01G033000 [Diphasiastrum complanatum]